MRWASALSLKMDTEKAVDECLTALRRGLHQSTPDLLLMFPSGEHAERHAQIAAALRDSWPDAVLTGCSAAGVIGGGHEAEGMTAVAITAAVLPGVKIRKLRIDPDTIPGLDVSPKVWRNVVGIEEPAGWSFVLLADPFTSRAEELLAGLDYAYPGCPKIGGLASGSPAPAGNRLFLDDDVFSDGVVGLALSGNVRMDTVVAQGGRPFGPDLAVTRSERNILFRLDDRPALEVFQEIWEEASAEMPEGEPPSFFVGIQAEEVGGGEGEGEPGDFLIRAILGVDPRAGAIAVGSVLRDGQKVRFHLMSPRTAEDDLRGLLERYRGRAEADHARGALLFSCNGRGQNLFGTPDHDTNLFHETLRADLPLGGLFCAGEIGPIGSSTYVHGFTSSFGILGPLRTEAP